MSTWKEAASQLAPPMPEELLAEVVPALEKLEPAFRLLERAIPPDTLLWSDAEGEK